MRLEQPLQGHMNSHWDDIAHAQFVNLVFEKLVICFLNKLEIGNLHFRDSVPAEFAACLSNVVGGDWQFVF